MRLYTLLLLSLLTSYSCKKSSPSIPVSMTVNFNGNSTWTTTGVTTQSEAGIVYITGTSANQSNSVTLDIVNFEPGAGSYIIQNTGTGTNPNNSSANYQYNIYGGTAVSGQITITKYGSNTIEGSFDFSDTKNHLSGTFTAVRP